MKAQLLRGTALPPHPDNDPLAPEPELVSVDETCRLTNLGRSTLYQLIGNGTLPTLKIGKRRLLRLSTVRRLIAGLEHVGIERRDAGR